MSFPSQTLLLRLKLTVRKSFQSFSATVFVILGKCSFCTIFSKLIDDEKWKSKNWLICPFWRTELNLFWKCSARNVLPPMLTIFISCSLFIVSLILLREIVVPESTTLLKNCAYRLKVSLVAVFTSEIAVPESTTLLKNCVYRLKVSLVVVFTSVLLLLLFVALFYLLTKTGKHTR